MMSVVKDWIAEAAREIDQGTGVDNEEFTAQVIRERCPFKPDVVYMPVPRCDSCKHWENGTDLSVGACTLTYGEDSGRLRLRSAPDSKAYADVGGDEFGRPVLIATPDFGCVQWEQKEA